MSGPFTAPPDGSPGRRRPCFDGRPHTTSNCDGSLIDAAKELCASTAEAPRQIRRLAGSDALESVFFLDGPLDLYKRVCPFVRP